MAFPTSPINGQQAIVNGILYTYASATQSWTRVQGVAGNITLTGTLTAATINAATIGNSGATLTGTLSTAAQTNITAVGTLTGLTLSGTLTGTTINAATIGNSGATLTGTLSTAAQTNITSVGTLTGLTLSGTLTGTTINAAAIGNSGALLTGTIQTASQTNITGLGTITTGTWSATTIATNKGGTGLTSFTSGGALYATSTSALTTGTLPVASGGTGTTTSTGTGSVVLSAGPTFTGTLTAATINAATIGNSGATLTGTLSTAAQTNITSVGTLTGLTLSGTLTGTTINAATIGNAGASIVGNLTGSATTATTAQYVTGLTSSNVTTALGYTPANIAGDTFTGNITTTANLIVANTAYANSYVINGLGIFWSNGDPYSSGQSGSGGFWEQNEDFASVVDSVTTSYDLGDVTANVTEAYDIGSIVSTAVIDGASILDYTITGSKLATDITISTTGNILAGNVSATGIDSTTLSATTVTATGNITSTGYFIGDGSQLTGVTSVNLLAISSNVIPSANATYDLGSTTNRWNNIYTSDLSLSNQFGDWTIVEGEDDLFLYNNKKGKTYKFMLQEVDPSTAPPKRA